MLIDFTIKNFMSYKDEVSLSMLASTTVKECEDGDTYSNVTVLDNAKRILRSAAIYGANGSGKSSIIVAMEVFKFMVLNSFVDERVTPNLCKLCYRFDIDSMSEPIGMQMIFVCNKIRYRYGFEVCQGEVLTEWLYILPNGHTKESYCFKREASEIKVNNKFLKKTRGIDSNTRSNALFLSTAAQLNVALAMEIKDWFKLRFNVLSGFNDNTTAYTAREFMHDPMLKSQILQMLRIVDSCIKEVDIKENIKEVNAQNAPIEVLDRLGIDLPQDSNKKIEKRELEINTKHELFHGELIIGEELLNFAFESLGTKKLFALLGPFFDTIKNGGVLIIDEFGTSLHTQLSIELLKLFYSSMNKKGAQLIVTTHDTNLLRRDLLRRDQIWFAEKNKKGVSDLYSLVEYKINQANSVRNDASFSKDYLLGKYGAIPYFGNIEKFVLEYGESEKE